MKIGFLSMPLTGHLHPMMALGRKMQARGREVIFFGLPDAGTTAGPLYRQQYSDG
jgi:zeaxanthin glucosyltransferase